MTRRHALVPSGTVPGALTLALALALASWPGTSTAQEPAELDDGPPIPDGAYPSEPSPSDPAGRDPAAKDAKPGDHLTVYALTFSPGDEAFFKFGHNAIWIHDDHAVRTRDRVYNWGTFSFGDPALIPKFVVGRFRYWLSTMHINATKRVYAHENRWVDAQELDLSGEQKLALQTAVEDNLQGDKKYYQYDYFRDNCSTRVRDALDGVTGGAIREAAKAPGRLTMRQHMNRVTADTPAFSAVLNLALGDLIDKPTTKWDEAYLPGELQKTLEAVVLKDASGKERPLVKKKERIVTANRADPPLDPPTWLHYFAGIGLALGGAVAALSSAAAKGSKAARIALGLGITASSLVLGFLGLFFLFVWFFTDHAAGYGNENIFVCAPFAWALVGGGISIARGKTASFPFAAKVASAAAALALLGVVVKVLPWFDQANAWFLAMFVPPWVALAWGLRRLATTRTDASTKEPPRPTKPAKAPKGAPRAA